MSCLTAMVYKLYVSVNDAGDSAPIRYRARTSSVVTTPNVSVLPIGNTSVQVCQLPL